MSELGYTITSMAPVTGRWSVRVQAEGTYHYCPVVAWAAIRYEITLPGDRQNDTQPVFVYNGRPMTQTEFRRDYAEDAVFTLEEVSP